VGAACSGEQRCHHRGRHPKTAAWTRDWRSGSSQAIGLLSLGPSIGGLLIGSLGWRWVLFFTAVSVRSASTVLA